MMYKKVLGLFRVFPEEGHTLEWLCDRTHEPKEIIEPILKQLIKDGHVKGKRKFYLTGEFFERYKKYAPPK